MFPGLVTQHRECVRALWRVRGGEQPANGGTHLEHGEIVLRNHFPPNHVGGGGCRCVRHAGDEVQRNSRRAGEPGKGTAAVAEVDVVLVGE